MFQISASVLEFTVIPLSCVLSLLTVSVQAGETALDQAREHNNPEVALLLTKAPQVKPLTPSLTSTGSCEQNSNRFTHTDILVMFSDATRLYGIYSHVKERVHPL